MINRLLRLVFIVGVGGGAALAGTAYLRTDTARYEASNALAAYGVLALGLVFLGLSLALTVRRTRRR